MKINFWKTSFSIVITTVVTSLGSCVSENPFDTSATSGNGTLRIATSINGEVKVATRAEGNAAVYDQATLENNLVVYIERLGDSENKVEGGIIRKYIGKHTLPESLSLAAGAYVVEGWTGDSVSASWDKKFYRGYHPVTIHSDQTNTMELHCNIANVIVSLDPESLNVGLSDFKISFNHSRSGKDNEYVMTFGEEEIKAGKKAYFMMPTADHSTGAKETELNYKLTGKTVDGSDFIKEEKITGLQAAHEYKVKVKHDASEDNAGGALIHLEIVDEPVLESKIEIFPAPTYEVVYGTDPIDVTRPIDLTSDDVYDLLITATSYGGTNDVIMTLSENFFVWKDGSKVDFYTAYNGSSFFNSVKFREEVKVDYGILYDKVQIDETLNGSRDDQVVADKITIKLPNSFLKSIVSDDEEQVMTISVTDRIESLYPESQSKSSTSSLKLRFLTKEAPVVAIDRSEIETNKAYADLKDYSATTPYSTTLYGEIRKADKATNYGIKYRKSGSLDWVVAEGASTRAEERIFSVKISGLEPDTEYEYKTYCDGFEEKKARTFKTEAIFIIPNAGLEDWSNLKSNDKVLIPAAGGVVSFWDSGNHGSATMSKTVTGKSESMKHSGNAAAELKSQFVGIGSIGKFAAGNLFVGSYDKTDGTDGELTFGRPFNGSHPTALSIYANYRPGKGVNKKGADDNYIAAGALDKGQIYVALTTQPVSIKTKTKQLFDPDANYVVAYGEVTWDGDFGADGSLDKVTIPLKYNKEKAKTTKPAYLVIVCSASKYGDFFSGGEGSVMYVDDFELVYE